MCPAGRRSIGWHASRYSGGTGRIGGYLVPRLVEAGHDVTVLTRGWERWRETIDTSDADLTWDHIAHSPNASIAKAARLLDYRPRYSSMETVREALEWLAANGRVPVLPLTSGRGRGAEAVRRLR